MKTLKMLTDIPAGADICLYGAGKIGRAFCNLLNSERSDVNVKCFIDSFQKGSINGVDIFSPVDFFKTSRNYDFIIMTSFSNKDKIKEILVRHGCHNFFAIDELFNSKERVSNQSDFHSHCNNTLYAFYDRLVTPEGFDIIPFLFLAEFERKRLGCDYIHPVIVPSPDDIFFSDNLELRDKKTAGWWERNIIVPCCWLLPSSKQITVCTSRTEAALIKTKIAKHVFPENYNLHSPVKAFTWAKLVPEIKRNVNSLPSLRATQKGLDYVSTWINNNIEYNKKIITITLRELPFEVNRNSNLEAWLEFAAIISKQGFHPVFIRDTNTALERQHPKFDEFLIFKEAPWNMELRMALYETSYLNMFVNSGPAALAHFNNKIRYLRFILSEETVYEVSGNPYLMEGLGESQQLPGATAFQKTIWEKDTFNNIIQEFNILASQIDKQS